MDQSERQTLLAPCPIASAGTTNPRCMAKSRNWKREKTWKLWGQPSPWKLTYMLDVGEMHRIKGKLGNHLKELRNGAIQGYISLLLFLIPKLEDVKLTWWSEWPVPAGIATARSSGGTSSWRIWEQTWSSFPRTLGFSTGTTPVLPSSADARSSSSPCSATAGGPCLRMGP